MFAITANEKPHSTMPGSMVTNMPTAMTQTYVYSIIIFLRTPARSAMEPSKGDVIATTRAENEIARVHQAVPCPTSLPTMASEKYAANTAVVITAGYTELAKS